MNGAEATDVLVHEHGEVVRVEETAAYACQEGQRGLHRVRGPTISITATYHDAEETLSLFDAAARGGQPIVHQSDHHAQHSAQHTVRSTQAAACDAVLQTRGGAANAARLRDGVADLRDAFGEGIRLRRRAARRHGGRGGELERVEEALGAICEGGEMNGLGGIEEGHLHRVDHEGITVHQLGLRVKDHCSRSGKCNRWC